MAAIPALLLLLLATCLPAEDPLEEAKQAILREQNLQNLGGAISSLLQSDGAKQLGDLLLNAATSESGGQLLGAAVNLLQPQAEGGDMLSLLGGLLGGQNQQANLMTYLPLILQAANAFSGPEAEKRAKEHASHANFLPPLMEKVHLMFDHFMNTDLAKVLIINVGAEKYVKVFADEQGKYSYRKMVDMLENHSFRRHWIRLITARIAKVISYISDFKMQRKYLTALQHFVNSVLKSQGYPKTALLDFTRPVDSITAIVNHLGRDMFSVEVDSKQYVKSAVNYVQELFALAHKRGIMAVDQQQLSDKLADTINMEMIEPFARVNRAYRFAVKVGECDKYVMCLVNQEPQNDAPSLPGLRPLLSKTASLVLSWFLSTQHGTPYLALYNIVSNESNCQKYYNDKCKDFHEEEVRVTTEYVHNEL